MAINVPITAPMRRGAFRNGRRVRSRVLLERCGGLVGRAGMSADIATIVVACEADVQERRGEDQTAIVVQVVAVACCKPRSARRSDGAASLAVPYRSSPHSPQPSLTRQPYSSNRFSSSQGS